GREKRRRGFEDFVGALQLGVLPPQCLELGGFLGGGAGPAAGVDLGLADPLTQALGPDAELGADRADRLVLGLVLVAGLQDQANCPLTDLGGIWLRHDGLDPSKRSSLGQTRSGSSTTSRPVSSDTPDPAGSAW